MALCSSKWRTRVANSTCSTGMLDFVHQLVFVCMYNIIMCTCLNTGTRVGQVKFCGRWSFLVSVVSWDTNSVFLNIYYACVLTQGLGQGLELKLVSYLVS